jgi:nitrogen regulatory protein P-II 1
MYMITLVLHNPDLLEEVLAAWRIAGIHRATVLFSMGIGQVHQKGLRDDIPLIPSLEDFYEIPESLGRTIFAVVRGEDIIKQVLEATQSVVGDLEQPKTGILFITPVTHAYGLEKSRNTK